MTDAIVRLDRGVLATCSVPGCKWWSHAEKKRIAMKLAKLHLKREHAEMPVIIMWKGHDAS